jgi:hypothetical protein
MLLQLLKPLAQLSKACDYPLSLLWITDFKLFKTLGCILQSLRHFTDRHLKDRMDLPRFG